MNTIPATQNETYGFYGTVRDADQPADCAWELAVVAISNSTLLPYEAVQCFLDSSFGRHFADEVLGAIQAEDINLHTAITNCVKRWLNYSVSRADRSRFGVPHGVNYLTALVIYCEATSR
jgi:hypothetical protein